ncbi:MAG TPA: 16S rRNA (cytidine(1402)-2'-O)-methyltransferase [Gemmatimonadaceae bacterium]|nr:16S rRNA (cytidine(1402)-2'-O)-methyltransferase [Gemmatimonadaceae bacterium]
MTSVGPGTLYVVSTPIGHMGDFSFRAVETLRAVSAVLAEDTRHSVHLLHRYDIHTPLVAYHEHNEAKSVPALVARLVAGESFALISDAGTPLLSDPGSRLVRAAAEAGVTVSPVPGASALLAALVTSGLDVDRFTFVGFLPRKGAERRELIEVLIGLRHAAVLYEAPSRVAATLAELARAGAGSRLAAVGRELTKQFEETRRGTVEELAAYYVDAPPRGEVVMVIAGADVPACASEVELRARADVLRADGRSAREIAAALTAELGAPRNLAYRLAHE